MTDLRTTAAVKQEDENNLLPDSGVTVMTANHRQSNANILDTLVGENSDEGVVGRLIDSKIQAASTPHTLPVPFVSDISINGISNTVDAPYTLQGNLVFNFVIHNPSSVSGNLTLSQGNMDLNTNIAPDATTVTVNITSITLNNGESITFRLSGTAVSNAGGQVFATSYTVTARTPVAPTGTDFNWRSGTSDAYMTIPNVSDNVAFNVNPIVDMGDNVLQFRVPSSKEITSIRFGIGSSLYGTNELTEWTETTSGGFSTYQKSGYVPGEYHCQIIIGDR